MIAILLSWIIIFYTLFSLGDLFISLYNKVCKKNESYNLLDSFIIGMCFVLIPLQFSSIWFPSNHYILLLYLIVSSVYWCYNKARLKKHLNTISYIHKSTNRVSKGLIFLSIIAITFSFLFLSDSFDSEFYHHQNIRWNEEFAVVPGLSNLEDRFGFNSNHLLLSAIFSFRFIFGEAIYSLQGLLYILLLCWSLVTLIRNQYKLEYLFIIFLLIVIYINSDASGNTFLYNTSTDIIPILCSFYLAIKAIASTNWLKEQSLLAFILPISLITFKLSTAFLCIIPAILLIRFIKNKEYKASYFLLISSCLIILLWCIRNIYITGYLVYPINFVDLFSFDWKMPETTLILQQAYISDFALFMFKHSLRVDVFLYEFSVNKIAALGKLSSWLLYAVALFSPITIIYSYTKKKSFNNSMYIVYIALFISILFSILSAPDPRFMYGYILGCSLIHIYILLNLFGWRQPILKFQNTILLFITIFICYSVFKTNLIQVRYIYKNDPDKFVTILKKPLAHPRSYGYDKKFIPY